ncbi:hypothetical protein [Halosimplex halobium]|uniref:hypothetical protein n=1 Tax=Halosimplex halobium TaxID=3396618 RepID=UPI003F575F1D
MGKSNKESYLIEEVVSTAKRFENIDSKDELEPVDVQFVVGLNGTVNEVIAVTHCGGPRIEANLTTGNIHGYGFSERHSTHFERTDTVDRIEEFYRNLFQSTAV